MNVTPSIRNPKYKHGGTCVGWIKIGQKKNEISLWEYLVLFRCLSGSYSRLHTVRSYHAEKIKISWRAVGIFVSFSMSCEVLFTPSTLFSQNTGSLLHNQLTPRLCFILPYTVEMFKKFETRRKFKNSKFDLCLTVDS